jgi:hypothetical protein
MPNRNYQPRAIGGAGAGFFGSRQRPMSSGEREMRAYTGPNARPTADRRQRAVGRLREMIEARKAMLGGGPNPNARAREVANPNARFMRQAPTPTPPGGRFRSPPTPQPPGLPPGYQTMPSPVRPPPISQPPPSGLPYFPSPQPLPTVAPSPKPPPSGLPYFPSPGPLPPYIQPGGSILPVAPNSVGGVDRLRQMLAANPMGGANTLQARRF